MTDPNRLLQTLDLRGTDLTALARIRGWARRSLEHFGPGPRGDVLMVLDELASNAYEHTAGPSSARLTARRHPCQVVIEVDDPQAERPVPRLAGPSDLRGRGLRLVDSLSEDWGVRDRPGGKTVWARVYGGVREQESGTGETFC